VTTFTGPAPRGRTAEIHTVTNSIEQARAPKPGVCRHNATEGVILNNHKLRWALLCVAAATIPVLLLASPANASHTVVIGRGDSIDSLARQYHVSIADIAHANGIDKDATLRDGRRLIIPDPPRSIRKAPTMRRPAHVKGDRITIRVGPDESYRRLTLVDHGVELLATRKAGEWYQVELPSGRTGWIRNDFVAVGKTDAKRVEKVASHKAGPSRGRRIARKMDEDDEEGRPAPRRRVAAHKKSVRELRAEASHRHRLALARARARGQHGDDDDDDHSLSVSRRHRQRVASHAASRRSHRAAQRYARAHTSRRSRHGGRPEASAPDTDADVVRTAYAYRGVPYHYGGTSRNGFDCSGFTSYIYRKKGVDLPHSAADQFNHGRRVSSGELKAGDLVFFHTTRRGISHVGIYAGEGKFVHASSGGGRVRVDSLNRGYYKKRLVGARRMKGD
jgi:cell wall-associated NlpC family hydrolase/LysM repeat protein